MYIFMNAGTQNNGCPEPAVAHSPTSSSIDSNVQPKAHTGTLGVVLAMAAVALACAGAGFAQDDAAVKFGLQTWKTSGCADCHGPFADGEQEDDDYPAGPNLRDIKLAAPALRMTIRCGRAGTAMPSFDADAYTLRPCYGRPLGPAPG